MRLLTAGKAFKCFATQDEIEAFREAARAEGKSTLYRSPWRDADTSTHPDLPLCCPRARTRRRHNGDQ